MMEAIDAWIERCCIAHPDFIEDMVYGEGWKMEKPKKKAKKGEAPNLIKGENPQDVNVVNANRETALYTLCKQKRIRHDKAIVKLLLENEGDPNIIDRYNYSPLYWATMNNKIEIMEGLLKHGADPNIMTTYGHTALSRAIENKNKDAENLLRKYGARHIGETPEKKREDDINQAWESLIETKVWNEIHPPPVLIGIPPDEDPALTLLEEG